MNIRLLAKFKQQITVVLGIVYIGPDTFGTGTTLVRISLVFTRDLADQVRPDRLSGNKFAHL